jgi:hypothetical protein
MKTRKIIALSLKMKITEAHSSILKIAAGGSSEMLVNLYHTTRRHIPEDNNFLRGYLRFYVSLRLVKIKALAFRPFFRFKHITQDS